MTPSSQLVPFPSSRWAIRPANIGGGGGAFVDVGRGGVRERRLRPVLLAGPGGGGAARLARAEGRGAAAGAAAAAQRGRRAGQSVGQREEQALSRSVSVRKRREVQPCNL